MNRGVALPLEALVEAIEDGERESRCGFGVAAVSLLLSSAGRSDAGAEGGYAKTQEQGCEALIRRVDDAKLFPHIERRCFTCELEADGRESWDFAPRFDQAACGGDSASTLIDRYRVMHYRVTQRSPVILWYDTPEDRYLSWDAAVRYHRDNKRKHR
jgi:hypothetical protein